MSKGKTRGRAQKAQFPNRWEARIEIKDHETGAEIASVEECRT